MVNHPESKKVVSKKAQPKKEKAQPKKEKAQPKKAPKKTTAVEKTVVKSAPKSAPKVKTAKVAKAKVAKPTVVVEPIVVPVVVAQATQATPEEPVSTTPDDFRDVLSELDTALTLIKALRIRVAKLDKQVQRDAKKAAKGTRKKRVIDPNAKPSGFAKPGPVSDELRSYLGLKPDELIARTEVTKRINQYCKENNLQVPEDKRQIKPDAQLRKLLKMKSGDTLTFFNLQKYMKVHFPNKEGVYPVA